jgi:hypothetical protein
MEASGVEITAARRAAVRRAARGDYVIAAVAVGSVVLLFMAGSDQVIHWFLLPLAACGILSGADIARWLRGRLDLFDPRTVIACLSFYGFFLAPMLHVIWDHYGAGYDLILHGDWRPWMGAMAGLNAGGLVTYRIAQRWVFSHTKPSVDRWQQRREAFYPVFASTLTVSGAGLAYYLWQFGGISGIAEAFESNQTSFVGKGWLLVLAWPFTILSFIVLIHLWSEGAPTVRHRLTGALIPLCVVGMAHFLLMGWYGSRSATIWALFWMAGIVHYRIRRVSPWVTAAALMFLLTFMYFYGFYKERGREGLEVLRSPTMWVEPKGYGRDFKGLLLGDLARADSNAYILHNLVKDPGDYDYRWGLTYAGALAILIPKAVWPDRPEFKVEAGTEAQLGKTTPWRSSRVYGLSGEALLNFGPAGVIPMFAVYGSVLGWYRRKLSSWDRLDARLYVAPFIVILFVAGLVGDSDNLVFATLTEGALVMAALFFASKRTPAS